MKKYLDLLISQYIEATQNNNIDLNSQMFNSEFYDWVNQRQIVGNNYLKFIKNIKPDLISDKTAEIGKGKYDTLTLNTDTKIITPYLEGKNIIHNDFGVFDGIPFYRHIIPIKDSFDIINDISTFMTQNPYTRYDLTNWHQLPIYGNLDIVVGIYGNINDKDIEEKIKYLKFLKNALGDLGKLELYSKDDMYFSTIISDVKIKTKK